MNREKHSFPVGLTILSIIVLIGLGVMIYRYINGIGAISNLSDGRPWGLWISFDLYCGVALAAMEGEFAQADMNGDIGLAGRPGAAVVHLACHD